MITPIDPRSRPEFEAGLRPLMEVQGLTVEFPTEDGLVRAVRGVDMHIAEGEVLGIVGESGSGKSVTALATMRLLPKRAQVSGQVLFEGRDLLTLPDRAMRGVRGSDIAMIFQDPMTALNPVFTVGEQIVEMIRAHAPVGKPLAWKRTVELLDLVGISEPSRRARQYPHEFSGGMRQRAMIAMAVANRPKLLIADEPTTALDVTIQAQVMEVITEVQKAVGSALLLITHDLGLVAGIAHRVQVMYAGRVFENGATDEIFYRSVNPYTKGLLRSIPRLDAKEKTRLYTIPGLPPSGLSRNEACPFRPRCEFADAVCGTVPELVEVVPGHQSRCHHTQEVSM
ncbi:MAG: ABC transporter ATP-binding protein [Acidimicrobiia bacterium]|nr:ABC transporter ATP-binding protein [Acidimicrobiia bacterium]